MPHLAPSSLRPGRRWWGLVVLTLCLGGLPAQTEWVRQPFPGFGFAAVYDEMRQRTVLVGPQTSGVSSTLDVWEWDGAAWTPRVSAGPAPPWRDEFGVAYDRRQQCVVIFGGEDAASNPLDDTWTWDGATWLQHAATARPSPRRQPAMAFDEARGTVLLFGGRGDRGASLGGTWEWDGTVWIQRAPAQVPADRWAAAMEFDGARQRVVLFGGQGRQIYGDTWEWDGTDWLPRAPATRPLPRHQAAMVYDQGRQTLVLYGGADGFRSFFDQWEWDGTDWAPLLPIVAPPLATHGLGAVPMVYETAQQRVAVVIPTQQWEWQGGSWTERRTHAFWNDPHLAYDAARQRVVAFGTAWLATSPETWEWDGSTWLRRRPETVPPRPTFGSDMMAYDGARQRTLFYHLVTSPTDDVETWEWDGVDWTQRMPSVRSRPRRSSAMAYDAARQRVVLFGGQSTAGAALADTWVWNGENWGHLTPPQSPPARSGHGMAYDEARQEVVLFGGLDDQFDPVADTWVWDGTTWSFRSPVLSPPGGRNHLTYDSGRQRVVWFASGFGAGPDTWEWDGTTWLRQSTAVKPGGTRVTYDAARQQTVLAHRPATWIYGDAPLAAATPRGSGCAGAFGEPRLAAYGLPSLGSSTFAFDVLGAPPGSVAALLLAAAPGTTPLPGGCTLLVDPAQMFALPPLQTGVGFVSVPLPIPSLSVLAGAQLAAQGVAVDPSTTLGVVMTGALDLRLGE
ncbi:MAG: kelch repeat-containing protein [Planctomycetota bacterium]